MARTARRQLEGLHLLFGEYITIKQTKPQLSTVTYPYFLSASFHIHALTSEKKKKHQIVSVSLPLFLLTL